MKRIICAYFLPLLLTIATMSVAEVYANPPETPEEDTHDMLAGLIAAGNLYKEMEKVGKPAENCTTCEPKGPDLRVELKGDEVDLGNPYYRRANEPYVIYLKRTSKTPKSIDLKFKNGFEYCGRTFVGSNTMLPNQPWVVACAMILTRYEDREISLDLKNLRPLKDNEEEIIELKLSKPDTRRDKYDVSIKSLGTDVVKEEIRRKFFGGGHNVSFEKP